MRALRSRKPRAEGPSWVISLRRAQVASLIASAVDFAVLIASVEWIGLWYVVATAVGATSGAVTNYLLGRHWSFEARHESMSSQSLRYAAVSLGSLLLNSAGVWTITEGLGLPYPVSKGLIAILVGVGFNFPLHRRFVFRVKPRDLGGAR